MYILWYLISIILFKFFENFISAKNFFCVIPTRRMTLKTIIISKIFVERSSSFLLTNRPDRRRIHRTNAERVYRDLKICSVRQNASVQNEILFRWRRRVGARKRAGSVYRYRGERRRRRGTAAVAGGSATTGGSIHHGQGQGHEGHRGELATPQDARTKAVGEEAVGMHPFAAADIEGPIALAGKSVRSRIENSDLKWWQQDRL